MSRKFYAGIGSRETPEDVQDMMTEIASYLEERGYVLRSGNATGADQAFAKGVKTSAAQIWMPWVGFEKEFALQYYNHEYRYVFIGDYEAHSSVTKYHPKPDALSEKGVKFMTRNYRQVIGYDGEPNSEFILCWTPEGKASGGTAQALRIAKDKSIPVYNLFEYTLRQLKDRLEFWQNIV